VLHCFLLSFFFPPSFLPPPSYSPPHPVLLMSPHLRASAEWISSPAQVIQASALPREHGRNNSKNTSFFFFFFFSRIPGFSPLLRLPARRPGITEAGEEDKFRNGSRHGGDLRDTGPGGED